MIPGLYAQLHLPFENTQGVLVNPNWIHDFGQLSMMYVINADKIERRFVRLGEQIDNQQHIITGLKAGDKIAVDYQPITE